ncbi:ABC transporter substrate-binding protein [Phytohabitans sp. ZYX-F-186]|uniref:ABC transporter substrate-binding protein n=1 Tax=Phytohabitans maris TaxID=3071409 RepID=A0ABU0ZDU9_9ACTN|nr:ABC transporter substrate-binding protein [Phytohabitans sp. ZYX-F-186]MDQ7905236.1 ABC transporter substrate-binding protein [Phytohabitans sp. ZYX-F-186]
MRTSKIAAGIAFAALLAVSSACGSDDSDDSSAAPSGRAALPSGTAADGSMNPVTVGFHNLEGGSISLADVRLGFEAGVKYVNEHLGGVNGHPLKAIACKTDGTPEASVNCANQFVEQKAVLAVQGADFGADAMLPVLKSAGLAELGSFPLTPGMDTAVGDAYFMQGSAEEGYAANLVQLKKLSASKVAVVMVDNPTSHETYDKVISPAAVKLGLETKVFYVPAQSDWTVQSATVLAWGPDAISTYVAADALAAVPAFRSAGFSGHITAGSNTEIIPQLDPSVLDKVLFSAPYYLPEFADIPAEVRGDIDAFAEYTSGLPKDGSVTQRQTGFYTALMAAQLLRDVGTKTDPLTAEVVHAGVKTWKGDRQPFRTNGWDCSKPSWPGTTACGTGNVYATPGADRTLAPLPDQPVDISAVLP